MAILSTIKKVMPYLKTATGYVLCRLSSQAVEMDDGTTLQESYDSLNSKIEARTPLIQSGSIVVKGIGQKYISIFTLANLCEMFGVTTEQSADFTVYAENGDDQAHPRIPAGVVYSSPGKQWLWYWDEAVPSGKSVRMNYVVFYAPGSTVG